LLNGIGNVNPQTQVIAEEIVLIPINEINITNRLRRTDEERVKDLAQSISGINLLHPISVAKDSKGYILLDGNHRIQSFKLLGRESIPAIVRESNELINKLVEVESNLVRAELNAISTAEHIILREELLIKLGRKAVVGNNQYTEQKITNEELARQMGLTKRTYQYKKSVANLNPEVKDLLGETKFADNMMDMVKLARIPDHIQLEVANLLITQKARTFRRAWVLAHMKFKEDTWSDEVKKVKDETGIPKSVMNFDRIKNELSDICYLVSHSEDTQVKKIDSQFGTNTINNYSMNPEHSRYFINFYSKEGDRILDNFCSSGTNVISGAYLGRRVVGYDLSKKKLQLIESACLEYTKIKREDLALHHSCGVEMVEYKEASDYFDLIINDPPYIYGAEQYSNDPRDLCLLKNVEDYNKKMEECLLNLKRLIKPSNWKEKKFHPIVMKVGLGRRGETGLIDMATDIENICKRINLIVHDKVITTLNSAFQSINVGRCIEHKYSVKSHETNIIMVKYH
tara:strand:- start:753 stop:2294 length:1542 start_codon:yes stop_codon:yes gene_type:complete